MRLTFLVGFFLGCASFLEGQEILKINGSTTVHPPVEEAAEALRAERGLSIQVDTQGGSSGGISMLGDGLIHIGMSSKPLTQEDRDRYPNVTFVETHLGEDAVALVVSKDVWEAGVRALSASQVRDLYEGRVKNWKELGGPDRRVLFLNKEPGRGTWEVFAHWLYGSAKKAPAVALPEVGGNEEARNKVGSTRGAISQLSISWADRKRVFPLGIRLEDGRVIEASAANIADHSYPMSRPLFLLTNGTPTGNVKLFVDYMLSEPGQALVRKNGYLSLDQVRVP